MTLGPLTLPRQPIAPTGPVVVAGAGGAARRPGLGELPQAAETVFARDLEERIRRDEPERRATTRTTDDTDHLPTAGETRPATTERPRAADRTDRPEKTDPVPDEHEARPTTPEGTDHTTTDQAARDDQATVESGDEAAPADDADAPAEAEPAPTQVVEPDPALLAMLGVPATPQPITVAATVTDGTADTAEATPTLGVDTAVAPTTTAATPTTTADPATTSATTDTVDVIDEAAPTELASPVTTDTDTATHIADPTALVDATPAAPETPIETALPETGDQPITTTDDGPRPTDAVEADTTATSTAAPTSSADTGDSASAAGDHTGSGPDGGPRPDTADTPVSSTPTTAASPGTAAAGGAPTSTISSTTGAAARGADATAAIDATGGTTPTVSGRAADNAATAPVRSTEAAMQPAAVNRLVLDEAARLRGGAGRSVIEVRLDPPELGEVRMEIRSDGRTITVVAITESAEASAAMTRQRDQIATSLENLGMELAGFDVSTDARDRRDDPTSSGTAGGNARRLGGDPIVVDDTPVAAGRTRTDGAVFL